MQDNSSNTNELIITGQNQQQEVNFDQKNEQNIARGAVLDTEMTMCSTPEKSKETVEAALENNLSAFASNLGIDYQKYKVEFDTRSLAQKPNDCKLEESGWEQFDGAKVPLPKAPMGSLQQGLQTLAECFLSKKSGAEVDSPVKIRKIDSELISQTVAGGLQKFEQSRSQQQHQQLSTVEIQKRIDNNHKFQINAQRQLIQQGFEPKEDIKPTQNLYDMVESQPKYLIDEKKAESLEEIQPELAKTKLAKVLKEVPLLKSSEQSRPSISELFFSKMDQQEIEAEEMPTFGKMGPMKKNKNVFATANQHQQAIMAPQLSLSRQEGNYFGQIKKESANETNSGGDQQFNFGKCQNLDTESYDWNQTTSTCSNAELQHIASNNRESKLNNLFGSDLHSKDVDGLDDIDVIEINQPDPLFMKRTKSNNLHNKHNLEEEKMEEPIFSQTCKYKQPMFQGPGLIGQKNFAKAFPYLVQPKENAEQNITVCEDTFQVSKETETHDEQKKITISVEKCDHEKDSNSKNSDNRESCFSSKSTLQTENISDSRSSCRTPLECRFSNNPSQDGSENFKNSAEEFGRFSQQPTGSVKEKNMEDRTQTTVENNNNSASKDSQDDEMSFNQSINNDDLEQNQEINEFITYRQVPSSTQLQTDAVVQVKEEEQQEQEQNQSEDQEAESMAPVDVRSVDSSNHHHQNSEENNESPANLLADTQTQREAQSLIVPNVGNQEGGGFTSLLSLMNSNNERRRPGSFQTIPSHRQSFDSLDEELMEPPTMPLTLNRQPNIVQQEQEQELQLQNQGESEQPMQRNISLDSTELLEINLEVALPQPLRRQNAIVPQREQNRADEYAGLSSEQILEAQQAALREAFNGIEEEDVDLDDLQQNLPQLVRRPGIRLANQRDRADDSNNSPQQQNVQSNDQILFYSIQSHVDDLHNNSSSSASSNAENGEAAIDGSNMIFQRGGARLGNANNGVSSGQQNNNQQNAAVADNNNSQENGGRALEIQRIRRLRQPLFDYTLPIQRRQTLTEIFFNQTRSAADGAAAARRNREEDEQDRQREIREIVDRQRILGQANGEQQVDSREGNNNNNRTENNQQNRGNQEGETENRNRQADQGADRNRDQDLTLRSIFDSVPHFNFLDNRNSQQEGLGQIRNRMLRPRERFNFGGSNSGQNNAQPTGPGMSRINRDRPFLQLYDPSVNYRQLRAQLNESNQNTTSANNTGSGQGSSGRERLGGQNSNMTNSQEADIRERDSFSSGDEFTRIVNQAHKKSNQASKQAMEIQKFKDLVQMDQGHPKWEQEIEESLSTHMMEKLSDISKNLGVLSVLIYIRLNNFFKLCEPQENDKQPREVKEAHEQNAFNDSNTGGGVPVMTKNFLVFLAKRIMNIMHYNEKKEQFIYQQIFSEQANERDMSVQTAEFSAIDPPVVPIPIKEMSVQVLKAIQIVDKVFPSIDEIFYCIKKDLVQERELIVYKMIIDLNEALYRNCLDNHLHSSCEKDDIQKVNEVFIPCCLKFYKKLSQPQIDELILIMKEINSKITKSPFEKKETNKYDVKEKEMMFFKAERCNEKNMIKGNPVKILFNNFPVNSKQPLIEKEETLELKTKEDFIEFYQELKLNLRNKMHIDFSLKLNKNFYKGINSSQKSVGQKRDKKRYKDLTIMKKKTYGPIPLVSVGSAKLTDKTAASPDSLVSPPLYRSNTLIKKESQSQTIHDKEQTIRSSDISIRLQDSTSSRLMECSSVNTKYITVADGMHAKQNGQFKDHVGCGKTTTASSVAETTAAWASSNKCTAVGNSSVCSKKTVKQLRKKHLKAFKKRVESAYLLDNIL